MVWVWCCGGDVREEMVVVVAIGQVAEEGWGQLLCWSGWKMKLRIGEVLV